VPEWAENEPEVFEGDDFYLGAFSELSTCRSFGMSLGPIPWRDIVAYSEYHELERGMSDFFVRVIRQMDMVYLKWQKGKKPKQDG